jgi:hypothetical protein
MLPHPVHFDFANPIHGNERPVETPSAAHESENLRQNELTGMHRNQAGKPPAAVAFCRTWPTTNSFSLECAVTTKWRSCWSSAAEFFGAGASRM